MPVASSLHGAAGVSRPRVCVCVCGLHEVVHCVHKELKPLPLLSKLCIHPSKVHLQQLPEALKWAPNPGPVTLMQTHCLLAAVTVKQPAAHEWALTRE